VPAGIYKVQMRVADSTTSNALDLEILLPGSPPATPLHPQTLATPARQEEENTNMKWNSELDTKTEWNPNLLDDAFANFPVSPQPQVADEKFVDWLCNHLDDEDIANHDLDIPDLQFEDPNAVALCC